MTTATLKTFIVKLTDQRLVDIFQWMHVFSYTLRHEQEVAQGQF